MGRLLFQLDLIQGWIYEVIVSAYKGEGIATAAPIGITVKGEKIRFQTYTGGGLFKGLESSKCGVVNFISDPEIFYKTTFKEKNPGGELSTTLFERAYSVNAPRINLSYAYIEFTVDKISYSGENQAVIVCQPKYVERGEAPFKPYCRGVFAAIECIIHATRIRKYILEGRPEEAEKLIKLVEHYGQLVHRVAPKSSSSEIIDEILNDIREWRNSP